MSQVICRAQSFIDPKVNTSSEFAPITKDRRSKSLNDLESNRKRFLLHENTKSSKQLTDFSAFSNSSKKLPSHIKKATLNLNKGITIEEATKLFDKTFGKNCPDDVKVIEINVAPDLSQITILYSNQGKSNHLRLSGLNLDFIKAVFTSEFFEHDKTRSYFEYLEELEINNTAFYSQSLIENFIKYCPHLEKIEASGKVSILSLFQDKFQELTKHILTISYNFGDTKFIFISKEKVLKCATQI